MAYKILEIPGITWFGLTDNTILQDVDFIRNSVQADTLINYLY